MAELQSTEPEDKSRLKISAPFMLVIFLFALTFCGEPDLHDHIVERMKPVEVCDGE